MRCKILAALFFLFTLNSLAQNLEIYQPPSSGQGYYDLFGYQNDPINLLANSHVSGITVFYPWSAVDKWSSPCTEASGPLGCYWTQVDAMLQGYISGPSGSDGLASHHQEINLVIEMVPESNTTDTTQVPGYVYSYPYGAWCAQCGPQDMVTCPDSWKGDAGAPTCAGGTPGSTHQCGDQGYGTPQAGVWNVSACHLTGQSGASCGGGSTDQSGFPVVYEAPIMKAYEAYVNTVLKHYSQSGTGTGPAIGQYIGYIRIGLADGGENLPICTTSGTKGIWPSPQGLTFDLNPTNGVSPDWFAYANPCTTDASCQGKYAYIGGSPNGVQADGPGYVLTVFRAFQASRTAYSGSGFTPSVMANAHSGPPTNNPDLSWADQEASIFTLPCDSCTGAGFGQQSLSEYDLEYPNRACTNDWCALFGSYHNYGGNLYLQTTKPNSAPVYTISSIVTNTQYPYGLVTCSNCTAPGGLPPGPGGPPGGIYNGEGFSLTSGNPPSGKTTYLVGQVINANQFTCDPNAACPAQGGGTLYTGDYLPDTIPFAATNYASTIEVYFCDWEFAYNPNNSSSVGCQAGDSTLSGRYAAVLNLY